MKQALKRLMFGPPGDRLRTIKHGLIRGLKFHVDSSSKAMRLVGLDEREIEQATRLATQGAVTAFDIGANDGWYSLFFAAQPSVQRVFAFEPSRKVSPQMLRNLDANDPAIAAKITLSDKMVGDQQSDTMTTIDAYLDQVTGPIVLKIDVDGGEMHVLRGGMQLLTQHDCRIVLEVHTPELETECIKTMESMGYSCQLIDIGWYRRFFPEGRIIEHNRWVMATKRKA